MNKTFWSTWFVRHLSGKGIRVKIKTSSNAVHGGAGSVSQMITGPSWQYELTRIDNISVIRFSPEFIHKNGILISLAISLDEFKAIKLKRSISANQTKLEDGW